MLQTAERVYDYLCQYLNDFIQPPTRREIAADLHLNPSQVARALFWLEDAGKVHPGSTMPRDTMLGDPGRREV